MSVQGHCHNGAAARWLHEVGPEERLIFSRYTQMGFLRLLTSPAVMGPSVQSP